jgi:monothiol glutaredoxin
MMNEQVTNQIKSTLSSKRVVLFMKGKKTAPQCGFSAQVVSILTSRGVDFLDVDVLADAVLRQGLKEFSNWPTFPQLYVDGQLIGGCDIVTALEQSGELEGIVGKG